MPGLHVVNSGMLTTKLSKEGIHDLDHSNDISKVNHKHSYSIHTNEHLRGTQAVKYNLIGNTLQTLVHVPTLNPLPPITCHNTLGQGEVISMRFLLSLVVERHLSALSVRTTVQAYSKCFLTQ